MNMSLNQNGFLRLLDLLILLKRNSINITIINLTTLLLRIRSLVRDRTTKKVKKLVNAKKNQMSVMKKNMKIINNTTHTFQV